MPLELFDILEGSSFDTSNRFLLLHAAGLTLGDEPALVADSAKNSALDNLFAEAFEEGVLRFTVT